MPVVAVSQTFRSGNLRPVLVAAKDFCTFVPYRQSPVELAMVVPVGPAPRSHASDPHSVAEVEAEAAELAFHPLGLDPLLAEEAEVGEVVTSRVRELPEQRSYDQTH
jgi:hypothetical protein